MERAEKFHKFEKIFFRIYLGIIAFAIIMILALNAAIDRVGETTENILNVVIFGIFYVIFNFFLSVIRIIKYYVSIRKEGGLGIWRSITIMLTSPIVTVALYIIMLTLALSMASCTPN